MFKVVFLGTPDFSVPSLEVLANHPLIDLKAVISNPDRPSGRGKLTQSPAVTEYAKENKIKFFQTANINKDEEILTFLKREEIDFFVVLAFSQFLAQSVLEIPKLGAFNIHTSLLPKYRGAAPIQYALINGDTSSGVSIQKMVKQMDAGDLCHSQEVKIFDYENGGLLFTRLKFQAALCLANFIDDILNNTLKFQEQDESCVSFAPTLKKTDGHLNFKEMSAEEILSKIKAFDPWPGVFAFLGDKRLKVLEAQTTNLKLAPGEVSTQFKTLNVGTQTLSLRLTSIQLEGKKRTSDNELLNGFKGEISLY
jgi:methionyl-tRNA formyltransferase